MAIGVAMFGVGASGTMVALAGRPRPEKMAQLFGWASVAAALSLVASPALVHLVRLDATRLAWDLGYWPRLGAVYLLLALPFAAGAAATLAALALEAGAPGRLYGASFLGSGLGAALALAVLWSASPGRALAFPAALAAAGAAVAVWNDNRTTSGVAALTLALAAAAFAAVAPPWSIVVSEYKELAQVQAFPGARRVAERSGPVGWVVAVEAPAFRYAPGLSLAFRGAFPRQTALFVDGQLAGAVSGASAGPSGLFAWLPAGIPYALGGRERVLVIGAGGGTEVHTALAHGARHVTALELVADLAALVRTHAAARDGGEGTRVRWVIGDARSFTARAAERFDLAAIGTGGAIGASAAGVHALSEDFLHTVDAYAAFLRLLDDGGVFAVTRWLTQPPREAVRVILTAGEALRRVAPAAAARGLVVVHSWGTATVLVKPAGFSASEVEQLRSWAASRGFDLDWYPGAGPPGAQVNSLGEPVLFRAAASAVLGREAVRRFAADYRFDVAPRNDARPYPHHFVRLRSLAGLLKSARGQWLPFAEWGPVAMVATLAQSGVLALLFLVVPVALLSVGPGGRGLAAALAYFAAIGVGYLSAEIATVQQLGLLLGHPVYAVAAALAAFLVFSGLGSVWSDRLDTGRGRTIAVAIAALLALVGAALLPLAHGVQGAPLVARAAVALVVVAPPAFLMGAPFPVGLRALAGDEPRRVAWAWAANGFASVVTAPLAALIALEAGSPALFLVAALAYAAAAAVLSARKRQRPLG